MGVKKFATLTNVLSALKIIIVLQINTVVDTVALLRLLRTLFGIQLQLLNLSMEVLAEVILEEVEVFLCRKSKFHPSSYLALTTLDL